MQNNAPVPTDPQGGQPQDPKLAKQKKREEAEKQKRIQQEKRRQVELNMQLSTFTRAQATSVMDTATMLKLSCNTLKSMLQADHVAISYFEEHPEIRPAILCIGRAESTLPKLPPPPAPKKKEEPTGPKIQRMILNDEIVEVVVRDREAEAAAAESKRKKQEERDKEPEKPKPFFPVPPKEPMKPGTLPRLEYAIWDMPLMYKMKDIKQPAMIPDPAKFPDPEVGKFAGIYGIKSVLFLPLISTPPANVEGGEETVVGVVAVINVNEAKVFTQMEIGFGQKLLQALSKSVNNAPPDLPTNVKKVINAISKNEASDRLVEYYSNMIDDIFDLIVFELGEECPPHIFKLIEDAHKMGEDSKLRKIWFQINDMVRSQGEIGSMVKRALTELYVQTTEFTKARGTPMPAGFKGLSTYVRKNLVYEELKNIGVDEEVIDHLEEQVDDALRGNAFFTDKDKAVLINDVEQSNMLMNYISAPAALDFRNNIKAAIEEVADYPEDVDKDVLLTDLTYHGLSEVSKSVCQDLVEKALFEIPEFLEQPQEKQSEQSEALVSHFHIKIMSNLVAGLKGKKSVWINHVSTQIKERAKEAAKKRAVMVGRLKNDVQEEEDY